MSYQYLTTTSNGMYRYKVTLNIFRDCLQSTVEFDNEIKIGVYNNNAKKSINQTLTFKLLVRRKVDPPGSITCDYYAKNVCIEQGFYEREIDLPSSSYGYRLTFVRCCRNIQNNLNSNGPNGQPYQGQTFTCNIPPTNIKNSSPAFSGVPSPYMCVKDTTNILNSAYDPDGDLLVYRMALPYQGGLPTQAGSIPDPPANLKLPIDPVIYNSGFNEYSPFGMGGVATVDPNNGLTQLYSQNVGSYVIAIEVTEYRNGIELSRIRLDLQILVLQCEPNNKPKISGSSYNYEVEAGAPLCFDITGSDIDNDNVTLKGKGDIFTGANGFIPPLASLPTTTGTGTTVSQFCWQPSCSQFSSKPYLFTAEVWDNGCPPKFENKNFSILVKPFIGADGIFGPDRLCNYSKNNLYIAQRASAGSTFEWIVTGGVIQGSAKGSSVFVMWNQSGAGSIAVTEISRFGCRGQTSNKVITILSSPPKPVISGLDTVCELESGVQYSVFNNAGSSYWWSANGGTSGGSSNNLFKVDWGFKGTGIVKAVETGSNGCPSDTAIYFVDIRKPYPAISGNPSVCPNIKGIIYKTTYTSGSIYIWQVTGGTQVGGGNTNQISVNWGDAGVGGVFVTETDRFGCMSDLVTLNVFIDYTLAGSKPMGKTSVCEFDQGVPYTVLKTEGSVHYWIINGGNQASGDSSNLISVNWGANGSGRVGVQERSFDSVNNRVCSSPFIYLNVTINPLPVANTIIGPVDFCQSEDSMSYTLNGFAGSTYIWTLAGKNDTIFGQGTKTIKLVMNKPGTYLLSVIEITKDSCPGKLLDTIIYVRPKPTTTGIFGDFVICHPNILKIPYSVSGFQNSTFNWSVTNGNILYGRGTDSILIDFDDVVDAYIKMVEISEFNCKGDTLELPVYINKLIIEMKVVSVGYPDNYMVVQWQTPGNPAISYPFELDRRPEGTLVWNKIASIDGSLRSYIDKPLNTDKNPFEYQVRGTDLCGNLRNTQTHTNILLSGSISEVDLSLTINFTPYLGWQNGVDYYEIYRRVNNESDFTYQSNYDPSTRIRFENNVSVFTECYRVKAYEIEGNKAVSWSNEICYNYEPNVFIPNAFTPNADNVNEGFGVVSIAVNQFEMNIFNRWGEKVYSTLDLYSKWDGLYLDKPAQQDVYIYTVRFTDYRNRPYYKSGTVHLMR